MALKTRAAVNVGRHKPVTQAQLAEAKPPKAAAKPRQVVERAKKNDNALAGALKHETRHPRPAKPVLPGVGAEAASLRREVIELPGLALDAQGRTAPQTLTLPADVVSVLIEVRGRDDAWYVVDSLVGPGNRALVKPSAEGEDVMLGPQSSPNPTTVVMRGSSALLAPNNPAVKLKGGAWSFTAAGVDDANAAAKGSVDVRAVISSGTAKKSARLPLNLFFTSDKPGYRAVDARNSAVFEAAVARFKQIYAGAGIEVGPIRMVQQGAIETPNGRKSAAIIDSSRQLGAAPEDVLKSTTGAAGLNVFISESLYLDQGQVAGVSGALPGPASPGTTSSGAIFGLSAPLNQANAVYGPVLGALMAHEVGHYLGLAHTAEADGSEDRLPDTGDTENDPGNLMFWAELRSDRNFSLSPQQAKVMLRHPLLQ